MGIVFKDAMIGRQHHPVHKLIQVIVVGGEYAGFILVVDGEWLSLRIERHFVQAFIGVSDPNGVVVNGHVAGRFKDRVRYRILKGTIAVIIQVHSIIGPGYDDGRRNGIV